MPENNLRDTLNNANPNRLADALQEINFGDIVSRMLVAGGAVATVTTAAAGTMTGAYVQADVQRIATLADALKTAVNAIIAAMAGATEKALSISSNKATLTNQPAAILNVNTTGTTGGIKNLKIGPITGSAALTPATGEVVWDGNKTLLFAAADVITAADVVYVRAADSTPSILQRRLGQQDAR